MHSQEAVEKFRDFLRNQLVDPLNRTGNYIYADDIRKDLDKSPYPKINLKKADQTSNSEIRQIGSLTRTETFPVKVEIITKAGQIYDINNTKYDSEALISKLGQDIETAIKNNHQTLCNQGFDSVLVQEVNYNLREDKSPRFEMEVNLKYPSP